MEIKKIKNVEYEKTRSESIPQFQNKQKILVINYIQKHGTRPQ